MTKKLYAAYMTYTVPQEEKDKAVKIIMFFEHLLKILKFSDGHLDLLYTPFKDNQTITQDQIFKVRAALRRYRDKVADNFNIVKRQSFKCFALLQPFSFDTQILKITKSFTLAVEDLQKQVNRFIEIFDNLKSKDFAPTIVKAIDNIKKEIAQLEQIIEDRVISHIRENILARNWVDDVSDEIQEKIEKKVPQSIELVEERK